jgi:hypothetical protein
MVQTYLSLVGEFMRNALPEPAKLLARLASWHGAEGLAKGGGASLSSVNPSLT